MSSFRSDISTKIRHSLAGFSVSSISESGLDQLDDDGRWLVSYAAKCAGDKKYPARADLNPADMKRILPQVLILEPRLGMTGKILDIKVRLMGTAVSGFYGEAGGNSVRDFADPMAAQRAFECVQYGLACGEVVVGSSFKLNHTLPYSQVTVLLIPLAEEGDTVTHFFVHVSIATEKS